MTQSKRILIEASDIFKTFSSLFSRRKVNALNGVSVTIHEGEIFAVLGPNGAGKSTFLKLILGQLFPTRGMIKIAGSAPSYTLLKSRIGYLPEQVAFWPHFSAIETLRFFGKLHGLTSSEITQRTTQLFEMLGIAHAAHRNCNEFSHGMRKRLGLAIALLHDPEILILDEPTAGMDPLGCREFKDLILSLSHRGKTIVLTSHLLSDVQDICTHACIFYGGIILKQGELKSLLEKKEELVLKFSLKEESSQNLLTQLDTVVKKYHPSISNGEYSLETLFLKLVHAAKDTYVTEGAQSGGGVANFLEVDSKIIKNLTVNQAQTQEKVEVDSIALTALTEEDDPLLDDLADIDRSAIDALTKFK